jgi:hypothetical protein
MARPKNNSSKRKAVKQPSKSRAHRSGVYIRKKQISPKQLEWISAYIQLDSVKKAAQAVGVKEETAKQWKRGALVKAELEKAREKVRKKVGYTLESGMREAEAAKQFAIKKGNANAYVKAVELKLKLNGLLIEKHDHRMVANFSISVQGVRGAPQRLESSKQEQLTDGQTVEAEVIDEG